MNVIELYVLSAYFVLWESNKCPPAFLTDPIFEIEVCWSLEVDNITGSLKKAQSLKNKGNDCFLVHSESIVIGKLGNGCWVT